MNLINNNDYTIRWEDLHAQIFASLVNNLNNHRIKYFILRNFEGLPEKNTSKDIDIIIEPGSYKKAAEILYEVFKAHNISSYKVVKYERVRCWFGMDVEKNFSIHIDLIEGYLSKGYEVFPFDLLYKNTQDYNNFKVLNSSFDAIMLLYYKVIGTKELKKKYQQKITAIYETEKEKINQVLKQTLTNNCSATIISALDKKDYKGIVDNAQWISVVSKRKALLNQPINTSVNVLKFFIEKFYRIIICPRKYQNFIAVEGADGTGKSTFIDGLANAIAYYNVSEVTKSHIYHHRPTILPNLGAMGEKAGIMKENKDFTNPHRRKPAGSISSFFRMIYYWLDYVIGVPLLLRKDVQFDRFTIYDRYIYDFIVDPFRSRINLPYWVRATFSKLVLQPRIVFVLLTDAEIIYKRKQELTIDEINRQLGEFSKLANSNKRFVVIDASQTPEEMVEQAAQIIIERFAWKLK